MKRSFILIALLAAASCGSNGSGSRSPYSDTVCTCSGRDLDSDQTKSARRR